MPSIYEVAKQAGVSASTVSRTFNAPHLINGETKKRIMEVAERINYCPPRSRAARDTPEPRHGSLGFHFFAERPEDTLHRNAFYSQVLAGALSEASDLDLRLILSSSGRHDSAAPLPRMADDPTLAGVLFVGMANPTLVERFMGKISNIVFVDTNDAAHKHHYVISDNFGGGLTMANYLIGLGHRRIAFVTGLDDADSFSERLGGYASAHFRAGLPLDQSLIFRKEQTEIQACLRRPDRPTAIMCANDECALVVMQICQQMGILIPQDLSLTGFDDLEYAAKMMPPLTTMHAPAETLGRIGVRRLYANIMEGANPQHVGLPAGTLVPVSLVERASCRPPMAAP